MTLPGVVDDDVRQHHKNRNRDRAEPFGLSADRAESTENKIGKDVGFVPLDDIPCDGEGSERHVQHVRFGKPAPERQAVDRQENPGCRYGDLPAPETERNDACRPERRQCRQRAWNACNQFRGNAFVEKSKQRDEPVTDNRFVEIQFKIDGRLDEIAAQEHLPDNAGPSGFRS